MKNEIIIDGEVYVKKSSITNVVIGRQNITIGVKEEYKIGDIVNYNNYEWYIIDIKEDDYTLFMKGRMNKELIQELFTDKRMLDDYCDVSFSRNKENVWWSDSYIRQVLNTKFLEKFNISELTEMKTTVSINEENSTTKDYIRLITKEECDELDKIVLKTNETYGYWTMSPSHYSSYANEFYVTFTGDISNNLYVTAGYGVRPVISVKKEAID